MPVRSKPEVQKAGVGRRLARGSAGPDVTAHPTPIRISRRTRTVLTLAAIAALAYAVYLVPSVLTTAIGGLALALVLSFPVRFFSRFVSHGIAIVLSFLLVVGIFVAAALYLVPIVVGQFSSLVSAAPGIAASAEQYLRGVLDALENRGVLPNDDPQQLVSRVRENLVDTVRSIGSSLIGGVLGFVYSTVNFLVTLLGALFIGIYLLVDVRKIKAAYLMSAPHDYRSDARSLWNAFGYSLSRYLGGLALILLIQGAVSALGLALIGVPYALVLGAIVSVTAIIPYLGAFLGAIPALLVALALEGPPEALLTAVLFLGVQQLEGNFLTPKIQGDTLHVHPILVFLGVIVGGGLFGILGVIVAVPALAVLRVLFDFLRVRLRTDEPGEGRVWKKREPPKAGVTPDP
ncbi:MAG: Uncharacterized UPF0118 membrane protein [uncultured Rubrobacteraceae bacterium]|uniref:Uncharacterized UPF0118 membrane protein n=1 Tax=uncultured Rubrobacteraceae bacterium TaxID=349277 RepID=A0A6J4RWN2_9ACTN|nr:MAG: Uncharacterized UPF0118 membrane protein [uncultured Rubrobacteraceae bacterium]